MLDFRERRVEFPKAAKMDDLSSLRGRGGDCRRRVQKGAAQRARILSKRRAAAIFSEMRTLNSRFTIVNYCLVVGRRQSNGSDLLRQLADRILVR